MESLAMFVAFMLLAILVLAVASLVLSILVNVGKLPKLVGYIAVGVQSVLTIFAFQITQMLGLISLTLLGICLVLVFVGGSKGKK